MSQGFDFLTLYLGLRLGIKRINNLDLHGVPKKLKTFAWGRVEKFKFFRYIVYCSGFNLFYYCVNFGRER